VRPEPNLCDDESEEEEEEEEVKGTKQGREVGGPRGGRGVK
jgi:hypothetical protein